jgi:superfamily II DNA or RNA helicase
MKPLWDHQTKAIALLRDELRTGGKRVVLQLPTGSGKTRLAAEIINMARAKGNRVIFTVPAISLVDQTAQAFYEEGIREIGVLQAQHAMTDPEQPVQIASIQTLARRQIPPAKLVMVDEAHRMSQFVTDWMGRDEWWGIPFVGLSATPWAKGMGRLYDRLIIGATTRELIDAGHLCDFVVYAPAEKPDLSQVRTVAGDYHEGDLSKVMNQKVLVADIISTWLEKAEGRPTLVFSVDRAHAAHLQSEFEKAGVRAGYIDANTPLDEREITRRKLDRGDYQVVCNVGCLTTGVDWDVRCIVLARPTKSEMLYVQIVGRGLRTAKGKDRLLLLDHSESTKKLGFVTDIHHSRLSEGKLADHANVEVLDKEPPKPKECPSCRLLVPIGVYVCPNCGFQAKRPNKVETQDGELVELDSKRQAKAKREATPSEKRQFYAELLGYAEMYGKTEKWALANFRDRYGEWPYNSRHAISEEPSLLTRAWVKQKQIAYAKKMETRRAV